MDVNSAESAVYNMMSIIVKSAFIPSFGLESEKRILVKIPCMAEINSSTIFQQSTELGKFGPGRVSPP